MGHQTLITVTDNGVTTHVVADSRGDTAEEALAAVQSAVELFGPGKEKTFRVEPEVSTATDFAVGIQHKGYVRFSYPSEGTKK